MLLMLNFKHCDFFANSQKLMMLQNIVYHWMYK